MLGNSSGTQNSYTSNVIIGNWSEDRILKEVQHNEYLYKKEHGLLLSAQVGNLLNRSLAETELTYCADGHLKFGDSVMLYSVATDGVVSVDLSTEINSLEKGFAVTTSTLTQAPVARNVFTIEPFGSSQLGDPLLLGDKFRLRASDKLIPGGAYLASQLVSTQSFAKHSRHQEVYVTTTNTTADTVFRAAFKDVGTRFEMEGSPVPANAELVIQHVLTGAALSTSKRFEALNDYGKEFELAAHSFISAKKKQGLEQEATGRTTSDIPVRAETSENHFAFLTAAQPPAPAPAEEATF